MKKYNYVLKMSENVGNVITIRTHSIRVFTTHLRMINWEDCHSKVYLRISYGKHEDKDGKKTTFYNDGEYDNKMEFTLALEAFKSAY